MRQGLRELGYVKNIEIEVHFVDGDRERTQNAIRTLVQKGVDILVVRATPAANIVKAMTQTIPIVMQVSDPLATGLVKSLSHPGGSARLPVRKRVRRQVEEGRISGSSPEQTSIT